MADSYEFLKAHYDRITREQAERAESALRAQVQALIEQWRSESTNVATGRDYGYGLRMVATTLKVCADQLEALLAAPK